MKSDLRITAKGVVRVFIRKDGVDVPVDTIHNAVQSKGPLALAGALAKGFKISSVWFLHSSSSSPSSIGASAGTLTAAQLLTIGGSSGNGLIACPAYATSVDTVTLTGAGKATFLSVTADGTVKAGASFTNGRYVFAAGLIQATDDGDVLYAACDLTPVAKAANSQIGVRWTTTITVS